MTKNSKFYCTKCGSNDIRVRWHKGGYESRGINCCGRYDKNKQNSEHLHYYCDCCLFDWVGPVLEAEDHKKIKEYSLCAPPIYL